MASGKKDETEETATAFNLSSSSVEFQAKKNDIFGCLSALEDKHTAHEKNRNTRDDEQLWKIDPVTDDKIQCTQKQTQKRSRESSDSRSISDRSDKEMQFKRPRLNVAPRKCNRKPDHEIHPDRWVEYTLEDVSPDHMSSRANTQAAFAFLEDRRKSRETESDPQYVEPANIEESACSKGLMTFSKKEKVKVDSSVNPELKTQMQDTAKIHPSFEDVEETEGNSASSVIENEVRSVSFKSKKNNKRCIRSRNLNDDDNSE